MDQLTSLLQNFRAGRVVSTDQSDIRKARLYDYQLLPAGGAQQLSFFQNPIGQGITSSLGAPVGSAKTIFDTNMQLPGQLPNGQAFLVESIEVKFFAGSSNAANTFAAAAANPFAAVAAGAVLAQAQDFRTVQQSGILEFNILNKLYVQDGPLGDFPPKARGKIDASIASNSATTAEVGAIDAAADGRPYFLSKTELLLQPMVNFSVVIRWPAAIPLPSTFNGRIGVVLDGYLAQATQ